MLPVVFGIISGIFTGLGVGGGSVLILLLGIYMNLDQHMAQATNLIFFIPTSIAAIIINIKEKNIKYELAGLISICGVVGSIIGFFIAKNIKSNILRKYFAIFILIIASYETYRLLKTYFVKNKKD